MRGEMPDLMSHISISYLLKRGIAPKENMTVFILGSALPDILAYTPMILASNLPSGSLPLSVRELPYMFLAFHSFLGFFLFSWWAALLFHVDKRKSLFINLLLGGFCHITLDMLQVQHSEFSSFFLPFSWQSIQFSWFESEASLVGLPFVFSAAILVYGWDYFYKKKNPL